MSERLTTTEGLKVGDVLYAATKHTSRKNRGEEFWWRRFVVVIAKPRSPYYVNTLTLKLHPAETDYRELSVGDASLTKIEEPWPQGVTAMHMKLVMNGTLQLDRDNHGPLDVTS